MFGKSIPSKFFQTPKSHSFDKLQLDLSSLESQDHSYIYKSNEAAKLNYPEILEPDNFSNTQDLKSKFWDAKIH